MPFSEATLEALRGWLDGCHYQRTTQLPAYRTRQVYPLLDLEFWWLQKRGKARALATHSHPGRYHQAFARRHPEAFEAYRLLFLHHDLSPRLPLDLLSRLESGGLLSSRGGQWRSLYQVTAIGGGYVLSSIPGRSPGEFVYLGDDSAHLIARAHQLGGGGRALDICCGCGVVGLSLPAGYGEVVGLDLNASAIELAQANRRLFHDRRCRFAVSDLYTEAEGRFDLIIGNPPALPLDEPGLLFAAGGPRPLTLTLGVLAGLTEHLAPGGRCLLTTFAEDPRALAEPLPSEFSLRTVCLDQFGRLGHHEVLVERDGQGRRQFLGLPLGARLRRLPLPLARPGPAPQSCLLQRLRSPGASHNPGE